MVTHKTGLLRQKFSICYYKKMKPLIGITTGEITNQDEPWAATIYGQKSSYSNAVIAAGGIPIFIPFMPEDDLRHIYEKLDGIVFAGGNDISPSLYNEAQHPLTVNVSKERDAVEVKLMSWAIQDSKPIFAICRGYQLLNVQFGGSLYQDILTERPDSSDHQLSTHKKDYMHIAHTLKVTPQSRLAEIIGSTSITANTHHHQGVKTLAPDLLATAWAEDGVIEAIEHPTKPFIMGVQCHPESLQETDEKWAAVFKAFVKACRPLQNTA